MHSCCVGKTEKYTGQSVLSPLSFRPGDIFDWFHHISLTTLFFLFPPVVWSSESKLPHICFSIVMKVGAQPSFHAFMAGFFLHHVGLQVGTTVTKKCAASIFRICFRVYLDIIPLAVKMEAAFFSETVKISKPTQCQNPGHIIRPLHVLPLSYVWRRLCGGKQCVKHFKDGSMDITDLPTWNAASSKLMQ